MKTKRILFVCYGLGIGGIEKCFVNLLNCMPEKYDIDVLLMNPQYTFKSQIKRDVNFINIFDYVMNIEDTMGEIKRRGGFAKNIEMVVAYGLFRLRIKFHRNAWMGFKKLPDTYDIAIAYSHHDFSPYYVIDKVHAKKKVLWFHNGAYEQTGVRYERDKKYYAAFDKIVAVSSDCAEMLQHKFSFKDKQLIVLRNICDSEEIMIKATAKKPCSFESEATHIVTVGRMTAEKGAILALNACRIIRDRGYNICWHWVGDGNQCVSIKEKIKEFKLDNYFILEGNQENPYPYIKNADVYVQPSYYEAYSTTVTEAKILHKPIVATDVGGMRDQICDGRNGLIVPISEDAIANGIVNLLNNKSLCNSFSFKLEEEDFSFKSILYEYEKSVFFEEDEYGPISKHNCTDIQCGKNFR